MCFIHTIHTHIPSEIIKEIENNGDKLTELLKNGSENLEEGCLDRALKAAVKNDNHLNVCLLYTSDAADE